MPSPSRDSNFSIDLYAVTTVLLELSRNVAYCSFAHNYAVYSNTLTLTIFSEILLSLYYTVFQKNVPPSTCYNLDIHDPITVVFGRSVTEKVRNQMMLCFPTSPV